ncbi:MAG: deoxyribonuclease, partial [Actinomycetota bacterium]|nr:deoxyribonuclease [Actinomycetota bacterium]
MCSSMTPRPYRSPGTDGSGKQGYPPAPEPLPVPVMDNHTHLDYPFTDLQVEVSAALDAAEAVGVSGAVQVG